MNFQEATNSLLRDLRRLTQRRDLMYLFLLAVVLRIIYMILMMMQIDTVQILSLSIDTTEYVKAAEALAAFHFGDQHAYFIFGPGYSLFLGIVFAVFGTHPLPALLIQIILSGAICLMLYRLGRELTGSRAVGLVAAIFSATSFTSISLANFLLSETLFFFIFLWGNLVFILALKNRRSSYFVLSGICLGCATLTRSMGQFWPLFLVVFILFLPERRLVGWRWNNRREFWKKAAMAPLIAIVITSGWAVRNYVIYRVPSVAIAGPVGLGRLSAISEAKATNTEYSDVLINRVERFREQTGKRDLTQEDQYHLLMGHFRKVLTEYPGAIISEYFDLMIDNATAANELYRVQLPLYQNQILEVIAKYREWKIHYAVIILSVIGLLLLAFRLQWLPFVYLGGWMLYVLVLNGFSLWQGSRTFFPAQMAWTILAAVVIVAIGRGLSRLKIVSLMRHPSDHH